MIKNAKGSARGLPGRKPSRNLSSYLVEQSKAQESKENQKSQRWREPGVRELGTRTPVPVNCSDPGASYGLCSKRGRVRVGWRLPSPAQEWK